MRKITACFTIVVFCSLSLSGAETTREWSRLWGTTDSENAGGVAVDIEGKVYTAGDEYVSSNQEWNVRKWNGGGTNVYERFLGSSGSDWCGGSYAAGGIVVDTISNAYVVGYTDGDFPQYLQQTNAGMDFCMARFDSATTASWVFVWGSSNDDFCSGVGTVPESPYVYGAGWSGGNVGPATNNGGDDACLTIVQKSNGMATTGSWVRLWGSPSNDHAMAMAVDPYTNIYVAGYTYGQWGAQTNTGLRDNFLSKLSPDGSEQWTVIWGSPSNDYAYGVAVDQNDPNNGIYVAGYTYGAFGGETNTGSSDAFLSKFDSSGSHTWTAMWGTTNSEYVADVTVDQAGSIIVVGDSYGEMGGDTNSGFSDIFITKFGPAKSNAWTRMWGSDSSDYPKSVTTFSSNIYVCGYTYGTNFDGQTNMSVGMADMFLTKWNQVMAPGNGWVSIDVNPTNAGWVFSSYPGGFDGPFSGSGILTNTEAVPGSYTVQYQPVAGYIGPSSETLSVVADQVAGFTGMYLREYGNIAVDVTPTNASWVITNYPDDYSGPTSGQGNMSQSAPSGLYGISFSALTGYSPPSPASGFLTNAGTLTLSGTYTLLDSDADGLSDLDETNIYGTDPYNSDSDYDGYGDGEEVVAGTDPLNPDSYPKGVITMSSPDSSTRGKIGKYLNVSWTCTTNPGSVDISLRASTSRWTMASGVICTNLAMTSRQRIPTGISEGTNYHVQVRASATEFGDSDMFSVFGDCEGDYDGDGRADLVLYFPPWGAWYIERSTKGVREQQFGWDGPVPVPTDFDGDGRADIALYYQAGGRWFVLMSTDGYRNIVYGDGTMLPAPGDFNGDGRADLCVYQPATGKWYMNSLDGTWQNELDFGFPGTVPVVADYDGDGIDDPALFYAVSGTWYLLCSGEGYKEQQFGWAGAIPAPADYSGDGRADYCVYEIGAGNWHVLDVYGNYGITQFGFGGAYPIPADYDGDGSYDKCVFWGPGGKWYLLMTTDGYRENTCSWFGPIPD